MTVESRKMIRKIWRVLLAGLAVLTIVAAHAGAQEQGTPLHSPHPDTYLGRMTKS